MQRVSSGHVIQKFKTIPPKSSKTPSYNRAGTSVIGTVILASSGARLLGHYFVFRLLTTFLYKIKGWGVLGYWDGHLCCIIRTLLARRAFGGFTTGDRSQRRFPDNRWSRGRERPRCRPSSGTWTWMPDPRWPADVEAWCLYRPSPLLPRALRCSFMYIPAMVVIVLCLILSTELCRV